MGQEKELFAAAASRWHRAAVLIRSRSVARWAPFTLILLLLLHSLGPCFSFQTITLTVPYFIPGRSVMCMNPTRAVCCCCQRPKMMWWHPRDVKVHLASLLRHFYPSWNRLWDVKYIPFPWNKHRMVLLLYLQLPWQQLSIDGPLNLHFSHWVMSCSVQRKVKGNTQITMKTSHLIK